MVNTAAVLIYLLIVSYKDIKEKMVSVRLCIVAAVTFIMIHVFSFFIYKENSISEILLYIVIGIISGSVVVIIAKITNEAIGYGDALIISCLGIGVGLYQMIIIVLFAFFYAAVYGSVGIIPKKTNLKTTLAFGPFLLIGFITVLVLPYLERG